MILLWQTSHRFWPPRSDHCILRTLRDVSPYDGSCPSLPRYTTVYLLSGHVLLLLFYFYFLNCDLPFEPTQPSSRCYESPTRVFLAFPEKCHEPMGLMSSLVTSQTVPTMNSIESLFCFMWSLGKKKKSAALVLMSYVFKWPSDSDACHKGSDRMTVSSGQSHLDRITPKTPLLGDVPSVEGSWTVSSLVLSPTRLALIWVSLDPLRWDRGSGDRHVGKMKSSRSFCQGVLEGHPGLRKHCVGVTFSSPQRTPEMF